MKEKLKKLTKYVDERKQLKEKLKEIIEELRKQKAIEKLISCKSSEQGEKELYKIIDNNESILDDFENEFYRVAIEIAEKQKIKGMVYTVIDYRPNRQEAVVIALICYITSIPDDELLDFKLLRRALKRESIKNEYDSHVAKKMFEYMYTGGEEGKGMYLDELPSDVAFVEMFIKQQ